MRRIISKSSPVVKTDFQGLNTEFEFLLDTSK